MNASDELWDLPESGCTDIAARRTATLDGSTLLGHNNDQIIGSGTPHVFRLCSKGNPEILLFTVDGSVLAGANETGLVLSGNTITSWDFQTGIPRGLLQRTILDQTTLEAAVHVCLDENRASEHNVILATPGGEILDIEATANHSSPGTPKEDLLSHTNHFQTRKMKPFSADPPSESSRLREIRAWQLLRAGQGKHTVGTFQQILSDHEGSSVTGRSICRHPGSDGVVTSCSVIFEVEKHVAWYCPWQPCQRPYSAISY